MTFHKIFNIVLKVWLSSLLINGLVIGAIYILILTNTSGENNMDVAGNIMFIMLIAVLLGGYALKISKENELTQKAKERADRVEEKENLIKLKED